MEKISLKEKIKQFFNDEKKRTIVILVCVVIILIAAILIAYFVTSNNEEEQNTPTTSRVIHTKKTDIFKGYTTSEIDLNKNVSYDVKKHYEFIYAKGEDKKNIFTYKEGLERIYELSLLDGSINFKEQRYNTSLSAYEYTGKTYTFKPENKITDYIVATTCEQDSYSIVALDSKKNIYLFNSLEDEFNINDILEGLKKVKTISKVSKIGYYNESNNPNIECSSYELVYLDTSNNVRLLSDKNQLFFDTAYYRYIGSREFDNFVYILKDGLMKYDIGNNTSYLYDGNYHIKYKGSFYEKKNGIENLYIIGTDGYLYLIKDLSESSSVLLKRVNNNQIKRIGTKVITNSENFATDKSSLKIEFANNEIFELPEIYGYELLN